ncbi:N-acetyltransferase [Methylosinus sp. C49]|uniref:GNAT family N-acetyltransferase n=1 Tax=Methylosinus sp. C49 TaxID=2699395 RepID=UPI0013668D87|nr:GNAT family protein [Methylosinus sp. C49]BBU63498.1 N-acetyltransferase [Methylosinus sp. C49]
MSQPQSPAPLSAPFVAPTRTRLSGRLTTLVPLAAAHADDLYAATHEQPRAEEREALWRYLFIGPFPDRAAFRAAVEKMEAATDAIWFAVLDGDGRAVGFQSYMNIEPANRAVEVGGVLYSPALQRSAAATEAQYLFAAHAFETLGCRRYVWKCDNANEKSKAAALRLGFSPEGLFRQHMIVKGRNRDTAWFSMLDSEWPARRAAFEAFLDPGNFDAFGRQKTPLSALNGQARAADRD